MAAEGGVVVNVGDVLDGLRAMRQAGHDLRPVWRSLRAAFRADLVEHFEQREGPEGPWQPWSPAYKERILSARGMRKKQRRRRFGPRAPTKRGLRRLARAPLGRLKGAWDFSLTPSSLKAVSRAPWSGVHQDGGRAGKGVQIPERTFMWVSDRLAYRVANTIAGHVASAFAPRRS